MKKKHFRRWNKALQSRVSGPFIDHLPRLFMVLVLVMVLAASVRIYSGGQRFLSLATRRERSALTETADRERPEPERDDGAERAKDSLGNSMGYELKESERYSFGHIETADGAVLYTPGSKPEKTSPFYNLVKEDEEDSNRLRMLPACYGDTLVRAYNPLTGVHAGKGCNVTLTLQSGAQAAVYAYMDAHGMDGTCVAYRPKTGAVTCLVSHNAPRDLYRVNENLGTCRPASAYKVILCALLEEQGVDTAALRYDCPGEYRLKDGKRVSCAGKKPHGENLTTEDALGTSCNCFFAQAVEEHLDWEQAGALLRSLGCRVNSEGEGLRYLGRLERDASQMTLGEDAFSDVWSLLGEGKNRVSPLDMVQWCGAAVNGGSAAQAHLVEGESGDRVQYFSAETARRVCEQWKAAYEQNYDKTIYPDSLSAAKTGTDQVDSRGNEALTLLGWSEELDTVFFIRVNNAVTKDGKDKLEAKPVDVARVLLEALGKEKGEGR